MYYTYTETGKDADGTLQHHISPPYGSYVEASHAAATLSFITRRHVAVCYHGIEVGSFHKGKEVNPVKRRW